MTVEFKQINVAANSILQMAQKGIVEVKMYDMYRDKKRNGIQVVLSVDQMKGKTDLKEGIVHLSVFGDDRTPSFREVYEAKNYFCSGIEMAYYFPVGLNSLSNVHHLWEVKTEVNGATIIK